MKHSIAGLIAGLTALAAGASSAPGPAFAADERERNPMAELCFQAWQEEEASHGGGELTLFASVVVQRSGYAVVDLSLGSGEGRTFQRSCRIEDGKVTRLYGS